MDYASQDYRDNMYGMSGVQQFLKKKKKKDSDEAVKADCGKADGEECGATLGGNETVRKAPEKKKNPYAKGEKNEVLTKEQAAKRKEEMEEFRRKEKEKHSQSDRSKF
jgi:hypothetical protein